MSGPVPKPESPELLPLMLTGVDAMIMNAYDPSIPINPGQYDPKEHFRDRISMDDARSVGIVDACEDFEKNRRQLISLAHLPSEAYVYALRLHKLREEFKKGTISPEGVFFADHPDQSPFSAFSKYVREWGEGKHEVDQLSQDELVTYHQLSELARLGNPDLIGPCIKAFAISILSQCWQAYEVLCVDLATQAISSNPSKLSAALLPIEIFRGPGGENKGIRVTYAKVFGGSAGGIVSALADQHLDYTFAIRNLFAHKAGKVDDKYRGKVKELNLARIIRPNEGEEFPLTGGLVQELGNNCFSRGYHLIREVYLWLKR